MKRASLLFLCRSLFGCQASELGTEGGPLSPASQDKGPPVQLTASCPAHPRSCNVAGWCWEHSLPPDMKQKAIWGTSCSNVWVVGEGTKTIHQWNGTVWVVHEHTGPDNLLGVWGSDADNAWAVGVGGAILNGDYDPPIRTYTDLRMEMSCQLPARPSQVMSLFRTQAETLSRVMSDLGGRSATFAYRPTCKPPMGYRSMLRLLQSSNTLRYTV